MVPNLQLILAVNRFPGHRGWEKWRLLEQCRDETDLIHAAGTYQARLSTSANKIDVAASLREAELEIRRLKHWGIRCHMLGKSDYPGSLAMISDPPLVLYSRGIMPLNHKPCIGIVGTRRPTAVGLREAYRLGLEFALCDEPVVSGLAFGIDRAAHDGALAGGGKTWAVLAGGLDKPSPFSHRPLASAILDNGGALLGEIPPGEFPKKYAFPRRNRILSGLCRGCVIVQAPKKSGALITADFALEQGRDVYVGSSGVSGSRFEGTRNLEEQGAVVVYGVDDVLKDWGEPRSGYDIETLSNPGNAEDLVRLMKSELSGHVFRYMGGWFELRGV